MYVLSLNTEWFNASKPEHSWYNSTTKTRSVHKNSQLVIKVINIIPICVCKENLVPVHFTFVDGQEMVGRNLNIYKIYKSTKNMKWSTGQVREEPDRTVDVRENGLRGARGRPRPGYGQGVFHPFFKKMYGCSQGVFSSNLKIFVGMQSRCFFIFSKNNYEYGQGTRRGEEGERYQGERAIKNLK